MKLLTANLLNGGASPSAFEALLERVRPDVLVAQEMGTNLTEVFARYAAYGEMAPSDDNRGRALLGLEPFECRRLPLPWRDATVADMAIDGKPLRVIGVHLANPIDGIKAVPRRAAQIRALQPIIESSDRCLLVGDLNATPAWPAYRRLRAGLDDLIDDWARQAGRRSPRTWGPRPGWPTLLRIDHVLGRGVRVTDHRVHEVEGSDHRAVEVTLEPT